MRLRTILLISLLFVACSSENTQAIPTGTNSTSTTVIPASPTSFPCQPTAYPQTIHYANTDNFGDGYISQIPMATVADKGDDEIVTILVTQWLDHYKTQSTSPSATIRDYMVEKVNLMNPLCDPFFEVVADVRFSIIPNQIPNDYASFPGDAIKPDEAWWHLSAPFGIFRDDDSYRLRLVFGWGT